MDGSRVVTVLIAVWAGDTLAYFGGRLVGRHKMAPRPRRARRGRGSSSDSAATIFVAFVALYKQDFLTIGQSIVLGVVLAIAAPLGDLFESLLKRDADVKDSGTLLGGHGGDARPDRRVPLRRPGRVLRDPRLHRASPVRDRASGLAGGCHPRSQARRPSGHVSRRARSAPVRTGHPARGGHTVRMTRVALLGATGSIGRQALEVIEANPELELVAATSGLDADRRPRAADPGRRRPDRAARARRAGRRPERRRSASPGCPATMWALEHGVTLALANKESLVAAGELALAAQRAGRRRADPGRQRALGALPVRAAGEPESARPHRERRPVPRPHRATSSPTSRPARRSRIRPGRWARRSRSTRRRSRTRASR